MSTIRSRSISARFAWLAPTLLAAVTLIAVAPANAATPFGFATGSDPDVAVDDAGTAHVVWHERDKPVGGHTVNYCQVPQGQRACTGEQILRTGSIGARPHVLLPATGGVLVILGEAQCGAADFCTYVRRSSDGGQTFGPVAAVADPEGPGSLSGPEPSGDAVYGPGNSVSYVNHSAATGMFFTNASLGGGTTTSFARLWDSSNAFEGSLALDGNRPVVTFADSPGGGSLRWTAYDGSGSLNDESNWSAPQPVESNVTALGSDVSMASGPNGLFVMYKRGAPGSEQYVVRKFSGSGFGAAVGVSEVGDPIFSDLFQDGSGRLHALWFANGPEKLQWRTSVDGGVTWGPSVTIYIGSDVFPRIGLAAAPDGTGLALWDTGEGPTGAASGLDATPLEPYTGKGSKVKPKDTCKWPNCLPAGGKKKKVGKKKQEVGVSIPSCAAKKVKVKLKGLKKKQGKVVVKKVTFKLGKAKAIDKKPAYQATLPLPNAKLGKAYKVTATIDLRVAGKKQRVKLDKKFYACPLG